MLAVVVNDLESKVFKRPIGQQPHVFTTQTNDGLIQLYGHNRSLRLPSYNLSQHCTIAPSQSPMMRTDFGEP